MYVSINYIYYVTLITPKIFRCKNCSQEIMVCVFVHESDLTLVPTFTEVRQHFCSK